MSASTRAAVLREQFDRGFAEPATFGDQGQQDYLAVDAGGAALLVPLGDVAGVVTDRPVVAIPAARLGFLGLTAHAGGTVPVYELAGLLGYGDGLRRPFRHLVLARGAAVAFAVDGVSGRRGLADDDGRAPHLHTLWLDDRPTTLVRLSALIAGLAAGTASTPLREDDR